MNKQEQHIVFLGIGGIGMSSIARHYLSIGTPVFGYDKVRTALTDELIQEGAQITFNEDLGVYPGWDVEETTVIYTPAMPEGLKWLEFFSRFKMIKRAQALGLLANPKRCLAVAGTHGKTSTSAMLLHILSEAGKDPTGFIGGIMTSTGTNYRLGNGPWVVVEADEFDRSFMHLQPEAAAVTTIDADHLDIYGNSGELTRTFEAFLNQVSGPTYTASSLANTNKVNTPQAPIRAEQIQPDNGAYTFSLIIEGEQYPTRLRMPGAHNVYNAVLAASLANYAGVNGQIIANSLSSFKGIKRRFEFHSNNPIIIEDYAHHPTELNALLTSIEELYPSKKATLVFQPHLYSRTRDFMEGFQKQLSRTAHTLILPIYPAREKPIPGITSEVLAQKIERAELISKEALPKRLKALNPDVLLLVGAGDIGDLVATIKEELT